MSRTVRLLMWLALASCAPNPQTPDALSRQTVEYRSDSRDFANPERGFSWPDDQPKSRGAAMSLSHAYFLLDKFRGGPISDAELATIDQRFVAARAAGAKVVPRFTYNFPAGLPLVPGDEDSALAIVLRHIG